MTLKHRSMLQESEGSPGCRKERLALLRELDTSRPAEAASGRGFGWETRAGKQCSGERSIGSKG